MQLAASCKQLTAVGSEQKCIGRVAGWAVHFDRLLADPTGHATFAVSVDSHCGFFSAYIGCILFQLAQIALSDL